MKYHADIIKFLLKMKENIEEHHWRIVPRLINKQTALIMPIKLEKQILLNLKVSNWYKGPERDEDPKRHGRIWVFHKPIDCKQIYIKIKLVHNKNFTRVISFHFDRT